MNRQLLAAAVVTLREAEHYTRRLDGWVEAGARLAQSLEPLRAAVEQAQREEAQSRSCRACRHCFLEPDDDFCCGHPDAGPMGDYVTRATAADGHCGPDRTKFEQHPLRTPEGNLICRGSQKELGRD